MVLNFEKKLKKTALVPDNWHSVIHMARFSKQHRLWCAEHKLERGRDYIVYNFYFERASSTSVRVSFKDGKWATAFALTWG